MRLKATLLAFTTLLTLTSCELTMPDGRTCTMIAPDADHSNAHALPAGSDYEPMPGGYGRWVLPSGRTIGFSMHEDATIWNRLRCARALPAYLP